MYTIDISEPSNSHDISLFDTGHETRSVTVRDTLAYVADYMAGYENNQCRRSAHPAFIRTICGSIPHLSDIAISGNLRLSGHTYSGHSRYFRSLPTPYY